MSNDNELTTTVDALDAAIDDSTPPTQPSRGVVRERRVFEGEAMFNSMGLPYLRHVDGVLDDGPWEWADGLDGHRVRIIVEDLGKEGE